MSHSWLILQHWHRFHRRFQLYPIYLVLVFMMAIVLKHDAYHYMVQGVDVSRYQRTVNWKQLYQEANVQFAFIKATEGTSYRDPYFKINWQAAHQAGIVRGAYHFYRHEASPFWQAKHFIKTVTLRKGDLPPVLDVEDVEQADKQAVVEQVGIWLTAIEAHYGIRPIIYASLDLYQRHLRKAFPNHVVWIARYSRRQPPAKLAWRFWQYTDDLELQGIDGSVDGNVFSGNYWQLQALCL